LTNTLRTSGVEITQFDPIFEGGWDQLVTKHAEHTIFHRAAWAKVLSNTYNHRPCYLKLTIEGKETALVPLMAINSMLTGHRGNSLPFSDFAGPLWSEVTTIGTKNVYQALLELAANQKWKHLELRVLKNPPANAKPYKIYQNVKLDLVENIETIYAGLKPSVRQALRKANRSGVEITIEQSENSIAQFYHLHCQTRKRHGLPPQPKKLFDAIEVNLIKQNMGFIVLAHHANTPIAGAIFLHSGKRGIFKFGASESKHWELRPNHAVIWGGICELISKKCTQLDFGRTSTNDHGLLRFKLSWGSDTSNLEYYRHCLKTQKWTLANPGKKDACPFIFGNLPIACNRLIGRVIYPHLD